MKSLRIIAISVLCAAFFTCKVVTDNGGGGGDVDDDVCGGPTFGCIQGAVVDEVGEGITTGAAVSLGDSIIAVANAQGWYDASGIEAGRRVFCFNAAGRVEQCREITVVAKTITPVTPTVLALRRGPLSVADIGSAGSVSDPQTGARIAFNESSFCDGSGAVVTGEADCSFTPVDVSAAYMPEEAPGSFLSLRLDWATRGVSVSEALVEIVCEKNGAPIDICDGKSVTVRVPVYGDNARCAALPAGLPGWTMIRDTAEWEELAAEFAKTCGGTPPDAAGANQYYEGDTRSLGWIHAGAFHESACLTGNVSGEPEGMSRRLVTAGCYGRGWQTEGQINENNAFCLPAPKGLDYTCRVGDSTRWIAAADHISGTAPAIAVPFPVTECPALNCFAIGDFLFDSPLLITTLTWGKDPSDLDAHTRSVNIHVYYSDTGSLVTAPYISLDTDERFSYGPEVTMVMPSVFDGKYCFYVRKFAGEGPISQESVDIEGNPRRAAVSVMGAGIGKTFTVPSVNPDLHEHWRVYTVEFAGGEIKPNSFTSYNDLVAVEPADCGW